MPTVLAMPPKPRVQRARQLDPADEAKARAVEIGKRISYHRTVNQLSQQQLAAALGGVDPRTLKDWEWGKTTPVKPTQTLVTELENAEGGAVTQGRGLNTLYVGPSCEVLFQIEQILDGLEGGDLTLGVYRPVDVSDSLEARIEREPDLPRDVKNTMLLILRSARQR